MSNDIDIYADDMEPEVTLRVVHSICVRKNLYVTILLDVDETGYIENYKVYGFVVDELVADRQVRGDIDDNAIRMMEVQFAIEYLKEWELAVMRPIGPEDSELFATKKLDPEWGVE